MPIVMCPSCKVTVLPGADGQCPSCRTVIPEESLVLRSRAADAQRAPGADAGSGGSPASKDPQAYPRETGPATGESRTRDYWSYVLGASILGGLVVAPMALGFITGLEHSRNLGLSVALCTLFVASYTKEGRHSPGRFLGFLAFGAVLTFRGADRFVGRGSWLLLPGLGPVVACLFCFLVCGRLGVASGRYLSNRMESFDRDPCPQCGSGQKWDGASCGSCGFKKPPGEETRGQPDPEG
jgi:hypothetical protein